MIMSKPFFYRIDLIDLMDFATEPVGISMTLLEFAKELKKGESEHPAIQKIITEAINYIEKKKKAGSSGGKARVSNAQALLEQKQAVLEPEAVTEAVTEEKKKTFSSSADEVEEIITKKKRKLSGKRLETFLLFWEAFNYKKGKAEAADSWLDIPNMTLALVNGIVLAAKSEANGRSDLITSGKTPKMAQGWLTARRWEDEHTPLEVDRSKTLNPQMTSEDKIRIQKAREQMYAD